MSKILERIDDIRKTIKEALSAEMDELAIYIDNDADLYRQRKMPIYKNLSKKMKKKQYNSNLAAKGFMYLIDDGAKKYAKEYGGPGDKWNIMFSKKDRMELAKAYAKEFEDAFKNKEYDFMESSYNDEDELEEVKKPAMPINDLEDIVKKKTHKKIKLQDGKTIDVDLFTASAMLNVRKALKKPGTQDKFDSMMGDLHGFLKLADFAMKHVG